MSWSPGGKAPTRDDLGAVHTVLAALIAAGRADEALDQAIALLDQLCRSNDELSLEVQKLQRQRSGKRTERVEPKKLDAMLRQMSAEDRKDADKALRGIDELLEADETPEERAERKKRKRRKRGGGAARRNPPPPDLPREVIVHDVPDEEKTCDKCEGTKTCIGEDVSVMFELVPARIRVLEHHHLKYACSPCKDGVTSAPAPDKLIEKGIPGTGLLADVVISKFDDAIPLSRQSTINARRGVHLAVSTLCGWVAATAGALAPLAALIRVRVLGCALVQTDASGLKVQDHDGPDGVRKGTMWCYVGDRLWCLFRFAATGSGEDGPWSLLKDFNGTLLADAANVFDRLCNGLCASALRAGCWAHAKRKFYPLADTDPRAAYPMKLIGKLYHVEHRADGRGLTPEQRRALRKKLSVPILDGLKRWLVHTAASEPPSSAMYKACAYSLNHWEELTRFVEDGCVPLDNNLCELQIRSLAVGRRNYLFAGSDAAAEHAAVLYSVLRTCALQGVEPFAYLKDVLDKLAAGWPADRLVELLPDAWAAARSTHGARPAGMHEDRADATQAGRA